MFLQLLFYRNHNVTHNQTLRYDRKLRKHFNLREIGNFGACLYTCTRIIVKQFSIGWNEMTVSLLDIHSLLIILMCFRSCNYRRQSPPSTREQSELGLVMIYISHSHLNSNHHNLQGIQSPPVVPTGREGAAQGCSPSVPALRWNMARGQPADWGNQTMRVKRAVCSYTTKLLIIAMEALRQPYLSGPSWAQNRLPSLGT